MNYYHIEYGGREDRAKCTLDQLIDFMIYNMILHRNLHIVYLFYMQAELDAKIENPNLSLISIFFQLASDFANIFFCHQI